MIESKTQPKITRSKKEKIVRIPYNIRQVEKEINNEEAELVYSYNELKIFDDNCDLEDITYWKKIILDNIKAEARNQIENVSGYTQAFQNNVANGISVSPTMTNYISFIIAESTRCEGLIENVETISEALLVNPSWPNKNIEITRTMRMKTLNQDVRDYIYTKYDVGTQISFQAIDSRAETPQTVKDGLSALFIWISGVMEEYYTKKALIRDTETWEDVTWDFSIFDATDPTISLEALMGPQ